MKKKLKIRDLLDLYNDNRVQLMCFDSNAESVFYLYKNKQEGKINKFTELLKSLLDVKELVDDCEHDDDYSVQGVVVDLYGLLRNPICIEYAKKNIYDSNQYSSDKDITELLLKDIVNNINNQILDVFTEEKFIEMLSKVVENEDNTKNSSTNKINDYNIDLATYINKLMYHSRSIIINNNWGNEEWNCDCRSFEEGYLKALQDIAEYFNLNFLIQKK